MIYVSVSTSSCRKVIQHRSSQFVCKYLSRTERQMPDPAMRIVNFYCRFCVHSSALQRWEGRGTFPANKMQSEWMPLLLRLFVHSGSSGKSGDAIFVIAVVVVAVPAGSLKVPGSISVPFVTLSPKMLPCSLEWLQQPRVDFAAVCGTSRQLRISHKTQHGAYANSTEPRSGIPRSTYIILQNIIWMQNVSQCFQPI